MTDAETFRAFYARTTGAPWPHYPREDMTVAFDRIANALADWADEVGRRPPTQTMTGRFIISRTEHHTYGNGLPGRTDFTAERMVSISDGSVMPTRIDGHGPLASFEHGAEYEITIRRVSS